MGEGARHDEVVLQATTQLIWAVGYGQRRYEEGERWANYSSAVLQRLGTGHDLIAGWRANNLATMRNAQGRFLDALVAAREAVVLKTKALGTDHYDVAISHDNVALAQFRLGNTEEAIRTNQLAQEILRRSVGAKHPQYALSLVNRAEFMNAAGRYGAGESAIKEALAIWEVEVEPTHPIVAYGLTALGVSLVEAGHPALAVPYLERALAIREAKDPAPEALGETRFVLARALGANRQTRERAMSLAEKARGDYQKSAATERQMADVDRWIEARHPPLSMR